MLSTQGGACEDQASMQIHDGQHPSQHPSNMNLEGHADEACTLHGQAHAVTSATPPTVTAPASNSTPQGEDHSQSQIQALRHYQEVLGQMLMPAPPSITAHTAPSTPPTCHSIGTASATNITASMGEQPGAAQANASATLPPNAGTTNPHPAELVTGASRGLPTHLPAAECSETNEPGLPPLPNLCHCSPSPPLGTTSPLATAATPTSQQAAPGLVVKSEAAAGGLAQQHAEGHVICNVQVGMGWAGGLSVFVCGGGGGEDR